MTFNRQPRTPRGTPAGGQYARGNTDNAATSLTSNLDVPEHSTLGFGAGVLSGVDSDTLHRVMSDRRSSSPQWVAHEILEHQVLTDARYSGRMGHDRANVIYQDATVQYVAATQAHTGFAGKLALTKGNPPLALREEMVLACRDTQMAAARRTTACFDRAALRGDTLTDDAPAWQVACLDEARGRVVQPEYRGALRSTSGT